MKRIRLGSILVYLGAVILIVALFGAATVYDRISNEKLEKERQESLAGANNNNGGVKVKVCRVIPQKLTDILRIPGTVEAYEDIDLGARMGGAVEWIGPEEGDSVKKGEKILQLDVDEIKARLESVRTAYDLARQKYDRTKDLFEKKVVSRDAFDDAEASLKTARSTLEEAEVILENGALYSPVDGVLDRRYVDPGEHIDTGRTIMKIVHIDRVRIVFDIPEKDILYFKRGQEVKITASNGAKRSFIGTVEYVAMTADPMTRTYPLKVVVENPEHVLRPGMIVRADLIRREVENGIAVPFYTLIEREDGKGVFIVEDGKAREVLIEYGMFQGGMVEITKGLNPNDLLVVVGQRELVNGEDVSITTDLTDMVKAYIASGRDLSGLAMDASLLGEAE